MVRYYITISLRNIFRNKGFAMLNITGFALGLSAFLLIMLFVSDELRYDTFNTQHEKIFRVDTDLTYGGTHTAFAITAPPVAEAMVHEFPEVKGAVRISPAMNIQLKKGTEVIQEDRAMYADQSLFDIFSFHVVDGNLHEALTQPAGIVISESIAIKYFGAANAAGKTLTLANDNSIHTVTAVVQDMPLQSHFHADLFLPLAFLENARGTSFTAFNYSTYVLLNSEHDATPLNGKLTAFIKKHLGNDMNVEAFEKGGNSIRLSLTALDDIHLYSNKQRELGANSDITYVYIFTVIATLILLLACINFTNLFTARSANRLKEVGVRKVLGSVRGNIATQFLIEAFIMTAIAVVAALALATVCLPVFNTLSGKNIALTFNDALMLLPFVMIVTVIVALVAGAYPAFYLSAFQPAKVLKAERSSGFKGSSLRNALVVFQFAIATFLVVGTLVILHQLEFMQTKSVGFSREQVLVINNVATLNDPTVLKQEMKQVTGVINTSLSGYLPTGGARWQNSISSESHQGLLAEFWSVDTDYIPTLEMKLVSGRNFSAQLVSDSTAIILNETAAKILNPDSRPLQKIEAGGQNYSVIGVVKDFNFNSLRENVTPLVMIVGSDWRSSLMVRTAPGQVSTVLEQARTLWHRMNPGHDFEFSFMDKDFEAVYATEQRMKELFAVFTALAIIIAALGLFGLSAYAAEQRTRELSIRKVLGATVSNLFTLLTLDFVKLIIISIMIALPAAWYIMDQWLDAFAYRITISGWTLFYTAAFILLIAIVTISYQTVRAALVNPAESLKNV